MTLELTLVRAGFKHYSSETANPKTLRCLQFGKKRVSNFSFLKNRVPNSNRFYAPPARSGSLDFDNGVPHSSASSLPQSSHPPLSLVFCQPVVTVGVSGPGFQRAWRVLQQSGQAWTQTVSRAPDAAEHAWRTETRKQNAR